MYWLTFVCSTIIFPETNPIRSWCIILLMCWWILFTSILWRLCIDINSGYCSVVFFFLYYLYCYIIYLLVCLCNFLLNSGCLITVYTIPENLTIDSGDSFWAGSSILLARYCMGFFFLLQFGSQWIEKLAQFFHDNRKSKIWVCQPI